MAINTSLESLYVTAETSTSAIIQKLQLSHASTTAKTASNGRGTGVQSLNSKCGLKTMRWEAVRMHLEATFALFHSPCVRSNSRSA